MLETTRFGGRARRALQCLAPAVFAVAVVLVAPAAFATTLPTGFTESNVASGLSSPNSFEFAPDGRIFICQQGGAIRIVDATGALLATPFATLSVNFTGERGLLGLALDPDFTNNHFLYVYYTTATPSPHNRISRLTANGNLVVPGSELVLLELDNLSGATNHNGGCLRFGPDGKLYQSVGENANGANAQNLTNLLGKILRINSDGSIPTDNPFFNDPTPGLRKEIWAYGFRNPWRFTFQPGTGSIFIADVGETTWEEVDIGVAGGNFGWPGREGNHCTGVGACGGVDDIFEYNHNGTGAAITGGDFYSGYQYPAAYHNAYFYGDSVDSLIHYLVLDSNNVVISDNAFATGADGPVEIRYHDNAIWYTAINTGTLRRIEYPTRTPLGGDWDGNNIGSIGIHFRQQGTFALKNTNSPGAADAFFAFGAANSAHIPLTGDWDGDGTRTIGIYDPSTGAFFLRNTNSSGTANITFFFGVGGSGYAPIVGDWDGDGVDTVGLYNPVNGTFFLKNSNSSGPADLAFVFGAGGAGVRPIVGDWDGNGSTTVGIYSSTTSAFFLRNSNTSGTADLTFLFGSAGFNYQPLAGNWDGAGGESIGLYDLPNGTFFLKNTNASGNADLFFNFGPTGP